MHITPEPTAETNAEIGRLCAAWSFLEFVSETALCGIIDAKGHLAEIITWRLDLRGRWQLILEQAEERLGPEDVALLREINKQLKPLTRDRNIIVHGLIHASVEIANPPPEKLDLPTGKPYPFERIPCWTIFRGSEAGKNFPVSFRAVEDVRVNIQKAAARVMAFNEAHGYEKVSEPAKTIERDWPRRI